MIDFNPHEHARGTDPGTSKAAAAAVAATAPTLMERILAILTVCGPLTHYEAARRLQLPADKVHKRFSDLKNKGLIEPTGLTRPGLSGRAQTVWAVRG